MEKDHRVSTATHRDKVALIRRGLYDHPRFPGWIEANGFEVVDAWKHEHIAIDRLTDRGMVACRIQGISLREMKHVVFLGNPWDGGLPDEPARDVAYRSSETSAALLAALWMLPDCIVRSPGLVFGFNRVLNETDFLRYRLRDAGWTLSQRSYFSAGHDNVQSNPELSASQRETSVFTHTPQVDDRDRAVLIVGKDAGIFFMDDPDGEIPEGLQRLAAPTCGLLETLQLDFATIAAGLVDGQYFAFGMRAGLPFRTPDSLGARLVGASLGRTGPAQHLPLHRA
jgi:hypothetical protein